MSKLRKRGIRGITGEPDKPYANGLAVYGEVVLFSNAPNGQNLRLVDGRVVWTLDGLLGDFEDKEICVTVKLGKRHGKSKTT